MSHRSAAAVVVALGLLLGGCTGDPAPDPTPSPSVDRSALEEIDPDREALAALVVQLDVSLSALRDELEAAAAGDGAALERAAALLVADVEAVSSVEAATDAAGATEDDTGDEGDEGETGDDATPSADDVPAPLLPGPLASRAESIQYGDLLTRTLAAARSAGTDGEPVLRFLADPLAGDLGSWQRAPGDQLLAIAEAAAATDLTASEPAVLELQGEAPRALAWVLHGLDEPDAATEAAGRALAHLAVIDLALDQLA